MCETENNWNQIESERERKRDWKTGGQELNTIPGWLEILKGWVGQASLMGKSMSQGKDSRGLRVSLQDPHRYLSGKRINTRNL